MKNIRFYVLIFHSNYRPKVKSVKRWIVSVKVFKNSVTVPLKNVKIFLLFLLRLSLRMSTAKSEVILQKMENVVIIIKLQFIVAVNQPTLFLLRKAMFVSFVNSFFFQ
jgi:hypothetical protein